MHSIARLARACAFTLFAALSLGAHAFMPASGVWIIDSEENGQPGRGFQIDVENGTVIFYYNGYRADGTSVFYIAFGPMQSNVFTGALREYKSGTTLGGARRNAVEAGSPGSVTLNFSSGTRGAMTLPGEPAKNISKFSFGYPPNPDGLLGSYVFAYATSQGVFGDAYTLTRKISASSEGNGVVVDATGTFGCENITKGTLNGAIVCVEVTGSQYDDYYAFRMSGDRGTGVGSWSASQFEYPMDVWRTVTASGRTTGLNEGTSDSLEKLTALGSTASADPAARQHKDALKALAGPRGAQLLSADEHATLRAWAEQARALIRAAR